MFLLWSSGLLRRDPSLLLVLTASATALVICELKTQAFTLINILQISFSRYTYSALTHSIRPVSRWIGKEK
jgi:ABC-type hemin transport system substrate-binding protein